MNELPDIIPFDSWINSQLSIAKYSGAITVNGKTYIVDYMFAKEGKDGLCFPDLVEENLHEKMMKDNPDKVKAFKTEGTRRVKKGLKNIDKDEGYIFF